MNQENRKGIIIPENVSFEGKLIAPDGTELRQWTEQERESLWLNYESGETPSTLVLDEKREKYLLEGKRNGNGRWINTEILDTGCGGGRYSSLLSNIQKKISVTGIDINPKEIMSAQENMCQEGLTFRVMNGTNLKFPDNNFDHTLMVGVAGGVGREERKKLFSENFRVTKPGGESTVVEFERKPYLELSIKQALRYIMGKTMTGEDGNIPIYGPEKNKPGNYVLLFIAKHFEENELKQMFLDAGFVNVQLRRNLVQTVGPGDGEPAWRWQLTVWGTKPNL